MNLKNVKFTAIRLKRVKKTTEQLWCAVVQHSYLMSLLWMSCAAVSKPVLIGCVPTYLKMPFHRLVLNDQKKTVRNRDLM